MVIQQHYYQLEEKHFSEVNPAWKVCHICIFAIIIVGGFVSAFSFGSLLQQFEFNCILFTDVQIKNQTINATTTTNDQMNENSSISTNSNNEYADVTTDNSLNITSNDSNVTENLIPSTTKRNITIDYEHTLWRPHTLCFFTQFSPIISMILAIVLIVFFIMAPAGGVTHQSSFIPNSWTLVFPTFVFSGFMAIATLMTTIKLNRGLDHFYVQWYVESGEYHFSFKNTDIIPLYYHLSLVSSYTVAFAWMAQCALLLLRIFCVADFVIRILQIQEKVEVEDDDLHNMDQFQARRANNSESSESIEEITEV